MKQCVCSVKNRRRMTIMFIDTFFLFVSNLKCYIEWKFLTEFSIFEKAIVINFHVFSLMMTEGKVDIASTHPFKGFKFRKFIDKFPSNKKR